MKMLRGIAVLTIAGLGVWWLLSQPSPEWYLNRAPLLEDIALVLLWVGAVAQTGFVLLWMTQPWFLTGWITRAIMVKSLGLALLLDVALTHHYTGPYPAAQMVAAIVVMIVVAGSVTQFAALAYETWRSRRERRTLSDRG